MIRRRVSADFDLSLVSKPEYEFRIEARIRVSHAPRRVNLHLNTQRTTDFHSHLMEFDIPDTSSWHTISMTTNLLELAIHSMQRSSDDMKDFGMVRVVEILGGNPDWDQTKVTYDKLCQGQSLDQVLNPQMIIDIEVAPQRGDKNFITISNPVLQRLIDGKTLGLALRALGAVKASFYAIENQVDKFNPKLHFNVYSTPEEW